MDSYHLFMFDFDGLLVNTEELHYRAYEKMCAQYGVQWNWDFPRYCSFAHFGATDARDQLRKDYPQLFNRGLSWDDLYKEKKRIYLELLDTGTSLMPGVEKLLTELHKRNKLSCVVTHSASEQVNKIRSQHEMLQLIPHWITREDYGQPKPNSECYRRAIQRLNLPGKSVIGFEDTPRGLTALKGSTAQAVWVSEIQYSNIDTSLLEGVTRVGSFHDLLVKESV